MRNYMFPAMYTRQSLLVQWLLQSFPANPWDVPKNFPGATCTHRRVTCPPSVPRIRFILLSDKSMAVFTGLGFLQQQSWQGNTCF